MTRIKYMLAVLIASVCGLFGCGPNAASTFRALGNDHSAVSITIYTPWGAEHMTRLNPTTQQSVTVSPDGSMKIESK